jgi:hypothetical protein
MRFTLLAALAWGCTAASEAPVQTATGDVLYVREGYGASCEQIVAVDADSGTRRFDFFVGVFSNNRGIAYRASEVRAGLTELRAVDTATGTTLRTVRIEGAFGQPVASASGEWLALQEHRSGTPHDKTGWDQRLLVFHSGLALPPAEARLRGNYWPQALSDDGRLVYLLENIPPTQPIQSRLLIYDMVLAKVVGPVREEGGGEVELGSAWWRLGPLQSGWTYGFSRDWRKIEALHPSQGAARTVALGGMRSTDPEHAFLWAFASSPDERLVYAVNGATGSILELDAGRVAVLRLAALPRVGALEPSLVERIARFFVPIAEAKRLPVGAAVVSPDGRRLYALAESGLVVIDLSSLSLIARHLSDRTVDSVAVSPDGERLYVTDQLLGKIWRVDARTGVVAGEVNGARKPCGVLWVVRRD